MVAGAPRKPLLWARARAGPLLRPRRRASAANAGLPAARLEHRRRAGPRRAVRGAQCDLRLVRTDPAPGVVTGAAKRGRDRCPVALPARAGAPTSLGTGPGRHDLVSVPRLGRPGT